MVILKMVHYLGMPGGICFYGFPFSTVFLRHQKDGLDDYLKTVYSKDKAVCYLLKILLK